MKKISKLLAVLMIFSFVACQFGAVTASAKTSPKVTLKVTYFKGGYGDVWFNWLKAQYEKTHPNVTINLDGDANLDNTITAKIEGGSDAPDVFFANGGNTDWRKWGPMGLVMDISDVYNTKLPDSKMTLNNFIQEADKNGFFYNPTGKSLKKYAVPWGSSTFGLVYNAKMFKQYGWKYPTTWKEFTVLCNKIKAKGIAPITYPGIYPNYARGFFKAWTYQSLGPAKYNQYLNPTSAAIYKDPALLNVWTKWQSLFKNGWIMNGSTALNHTQVQMEFINNKAAMILNGAWLENEMKAAWPKGYDIKMGAIPADGQVKRPVAFLYGSDYGAIYAKTQHPKEAKDFLLFSTSVKACQEFTELTGSFRPYNYDVSKLKITPFTRSCFDTLSGKNNIVINEMSSDPLSFRDVGKDYIAKIATNSMTPQQAFEAFGNDAQKFIDKTKQELGIK